MGLGQYETSSTHAHALLIHFSKERKTILVCWLVLKKHHFGSLLFRKRHSLNTSIAWGTCFEGLIYNYMTLYINSATHVKGAGAVDEVWFVLLTSHHVQSCD